MQSHAKHGTTRQSKAKQSKVKQCKAKAKEAKARPRQGEGKGRASSRNPGFGGPGQGTGAPGDAIFKAMQVSLHNGKNASSRPGVTFHRAPFTKQVRTPKACLGKT